MCTVTAVMLLLPGHSNIDREMCALCGPTSQVAAMYNLDLQLVTAYTTGEKYVQADKSASDDEHDLRSRTLHVGKPLS